MVSKYSDICFPVNFICYTLSKISEVNTYKSEKHAAYFDEHFSLLEKFSLTIPLSINSNEQMMNLLSMTPHSQRINKNAENRLKATQALNDHADFLLYVYQKVS